MIVVAARIRRVAAAAMAFLALSAAAVAAPHHVQAMAFYQGVGENTDLDAAFMASNFEWTEQSIFGNAAAAAYVAAGGKHAVLYTDPFVIFRCASADAGSCDDAESFKNRLPGGALLHDAAGAVVYDARRREQRPNYASPEFRNAYAAELKRLIAASDGAWGPARGGYVELDDMGNKNALRAWIGSWPAPVEIASDDAVIASKATLVEGVAQVAAPLLNGVNYDWPDAYAALFAAVGGRVHAYFNENCFATDYGSGYQTGVEPAAEAWQHQELAIANVTGRGDTDICWGKGDPGPAHRLYYVASFWMTYDAIRSVAFEEMCAPDTTPRGHCNTTWDDGYVVPTEPLQSASADSLAALRAGSSAYAREFARCFDDARPIGRCAAVVNPSGGATIPMPGLQGQYGHTLRLSTRSLFGGSRHTWEPGAPTSLAPRSAVILAQ